MNVNNPFTLDRSYSLFSVFLHHPDHFVEICIVKIEDITRAFAGEVPQGSGSRAGVGGAGGAVREALKRMQEPSGLSDLGPCRVEERAARNRTC